MSTIPVLDHQSQSDLHRIYWEEDVAESSNGTEDYYQETLDTIVRSYVRERMGLPVYGPDDRWEIYPLDWPEGFSEDEREQWRHALDNAY